MIHFLALASIMVNSSIIWMFVFIDVGNLIALIRRKTDGRSELREMAVRYLTIPFLVNLPFYLVAELAIDPLNNGLFWKFLNSACSIWFATVLWKEYKNRKNKKKLKERLLARVKQVGEKLVVVPVAVPVGAR